VYPEKVPGYSTRLGVLIVQYSRGASSKFVL
jgi:hypothetical protein